MMGDVLCQGLMIPMDSEGDNLKEVGRTSTTPPVSGCRRDARGVSLGLNGLREGPVGA